MVWHTYMHTCILVHTYKHTRTHTNTHGYLYTIFECQYQTRDDERAAADGKLSAAQHELGDLEATETEVCVFRHVAVCCSVLLCAAVCCGALQFVSVCWGVFQCVALVAERRCWLAQRHTGHQGRGVCVAVCCSVLQCVAVCCSALHLEAPVCMAWTCCMSVCLFRLTHTCTQTCTQTHELKGYRVQIFIYTYLYVHILACM